LPISKYCLVIEFWDLFVMFTPTTGGCFVVIWNLLPDTFNLGWFRLRSTTAKVVAIFAGFACFFNHWDRQSL
jgi:hypothetical protein